jgi:hypothetical protein
MLTDKDFSKRKQEEGRGVLAVKRSGWEEVKEEGWMEGRGSKLFGKKIKGSWQKKKIVKIIYGW